MNYEKVHRRYYELEGIPPHSYYTESVWKKMFDHGIVAVHERKTTKERYERYAELDVYSSTSWDQLGEVNQRSWQNFFQAIEEELAGAKTEVAPSVFSCTCSMRMLMSKGCPRLKGGVCE